MAKISKTSIITPIILLAVYIIFTFILRSFFPSGKALIDHLASIYGRFGYEIVIVGSLLEALILINLFTPGVAAVGLGVIFAKAGELDLTLVILGAVAGALVGFILDFLLGRFGLGDLLGRMGYIDAIQKTKSQIEKSDLKTFSLGFIHPNIGAIISLVAGTLNLDFKKFFLLTLLSTLVWYILWALLIFALGKIFLTILTQYVFILMILVAAIWLLGTLYSAKKD